MSLLKVTTNQSKINCIYHQTTKFEAKQCFQRCLSTGGVSVKEGLCPGGEGAGVTLKGGLSQIP